MCVMTDSRIKLFVIHGWGGSYLEAATRVTDLLEVESFWHRGAFLVARRQAGLLRHILNEPADDPYITALRKLIISRFMQSPHAPPTVAENMDGYSRFMEERLRSDFPRFGIPVGPDARWRRARQLQAEAERELKPVLAVLSQLQQAVADSDEPRTEAAVRRHLQTIAASAHVGDLCPLLENLREMQETGGDLDTVGSAVMYAHHFGCEARRAEQPFRYGHEYRFVFLNYHESMHSLAALAPADLYLADLPIAAFPEMEADIRYLRQHDVNTIRFEDHHPYLPERKQGLQELIDDGQLEFYALSGPVQGTEQPDEEQRSAAEMIYENLIENTADDTPAARRLREAAHGEDFVRGRTELGILLTDLIKGGICKVELGQILIEAMADDDAMERLATRGWADLPRQWSTDIEATAETLRENTYLMTLADGRTKIISALAAHADPGKPKLPTGKAIEFFGQNFPEAQYCFYCWGSSLMVARRLDQADTTLNLGGLMPAMGSPSDGGHAGAAVCRPEANPRYPKRLLGRVGPSSFGRFNQYLADRMGEQGYPVASIKNVSVTPASSLNRGNLRLIIVLATAIVLGLGLILFVPGYSPEQIRESNADFLPHLDQDSTEDGEDLREMFF
jgi:hypothetical protein